MEGESGKGCQLVRRPASLALAYARQMEGASEKCADENRAKGTARNAFSL